MINKPPHTSVYRAIHKAPYLDDEELTSDFNVTDADELPPMPSSIPSGRSFDLLGSISDLNHQDAFRALHGQAVGSELSAQIAVSSSSVSSEVLFTPWNLGSTDSPGSSESLSIQIEHSTTSPPGASHMKSDTSLGSKQSLLAEDEAEFVVDATGPPAKTGSQAASKTEVLWQTEDPVLVLRNVTLMYADRLLLTALNLDVGRTGIYTIVCAESFYRRLLLTMLAGVSKGATVRLGGSALFAGESLGTKSYPQFCMVNASELVMTMRDYLSQGLEHDITTRIPIILSGTGLETLCEKMNERIHDLDTHECRAVALLRAALGSIPLLCIDDPLHGLTDEPLQSLVRLLRRVSSTRAVLLMESEPGPLFAIARGVAYYQDGRVLTHPQPQGMDTPAPKNDEEVQPEPVASIEIPVPPQNPAPSMRVQSVPISEQEQDPALQEQRSTANGQQGPRGFRWLVPGSLAGTPEPGILFDIDYDLELLKGAGITMLVTLTEQPLPEALLESHGLKSLYFPIVDMNVPSCRATESLCELVELAMGRGEVIAFHCKAGLGRTGTLLVSYLIWEGAPPAEALAVARSIEPGWVQSPIQEEYLFEFAQYCQRKK